MMPPHVAIITCSGWSMVRHRREQIVDLVQRGWRVSAISALDQEQTDQLRAMGAEPYVVSCENTGINPVLNCRYFCRLTALLLKLRPDVVHTFSTKPMIMGTVAAKILSVPTIVCTFPGVGILGTDRFKIVHGMIRMLYRHVFRGRPAVIFQNADDLAAFVSDGIVHESQCVLIAGCGVDTSAMFPAFEPPTRPRFVMVSRMMWTKGVREFIEASRLVAEIYPEAEFQLVGSADTDYRSNNPDFVSATWLRGESEQGPALWVGRVSPQQAEDFMRDATAVVLLSRAREGVPRVLIEAAALGTPIITTDWPGCRDVVEHGQSGFLCRPNGALATDAATAMETLIEEPELAVRMGKRAREIAARFDKSHVMAETLRVYERGRG